MSPPAMTRRDILGRIVGAPVPVGRRVLAFGVLILTIPLLILAMVVVLSPGLAGWCLSPFVGLISPARGRRLALGLQRACDRLNRVAEQALRPANWVYGDAF